ncbi:MAG: hypothetical protein QMD61_01415 [Methanobacterium sp.]|nr:hypothetical protein [Methanobacterium sp.]
MSVEVIAIGGYEEVGKSISAKPLEKVSSKCKSFSTYFSKKICQGGQL